MLSVQCIHRASRVHERRVWGLEVALRRVEVLE